MINIKSTIKTILIAMLIVPLCSEARAENLRGRIRTSAAQLAALAGLEGTVPIVVGSADEARKGILPLANSREGKTYAIISDPEDLVYMPQPRFKSQDQQEELGADLFRHSSTRPYSLDDELYLALFRSRSGKKRNFSQSGPLRPLLIVETEVVLPERKTRRTKPRQVGRPTEAGSKRGNLQWVNKGALRKDF